MTAGPLLALSLALTGVPAAADLVVSLGWGMETVVVRGLLGACGAIAGMGAVIWLRSAGLTIQAGSAEAAVLGGWAIALILSLGFGAVPYFITPSQPHETREYAATTVLSPGETGAWSKTITSKVLLLAPLGILLLGAFIYVPKVMRGDGAASAFGIGVAGATALCRGDQLSSWGQVRV